MDSGSWFDDDGNYWIAARMLMGAALQLRFINMRLLLRSYAICNYCCACVYIGIRF